MATWTDDAVLIASLAAGKAFTDEKAQALAENVRAAIEGAAGAPRLRDAALSTIVNTAGQDWVGLRLTTPYVGAETAGLAVGAVGSYAFLTLNTLTTAAAGTTHAGSGLRYSNAAGLVGATPAGTWRLMGQVNNSSQAQSTSLFLRIS